MLYATPTCSVLHRGCWYALQIWCGQDRAPYPLPSKPAVSVASVNREKEPPSHQLCKLGDRGHYRLEAVDSAGLNSTSSSARLLGAKSWLLFSGYTIYLTLFLGFHIYKACKAYSIHTWHRISTLCTCIQKENTPFVKCVMLCSAFNLFPRMLCSLTYTGSYQSGPG